MVVSVAELAVAVRLSDDGLNLSAAQTAILSRLKGVGEAHVALLVPDAPTAVADEIVVRLASYLYEAPIGRKDSFAHAWVNSGAGALGALWHQQAASGSAPSGETLTPGEVPPAVATLDDTAVQALIDIHAAMSEVHHRRSSGAGIVNVENGRLASNAGTVMRIGWSESQAYDEQVFTRDGNHPDDGAAVGTIAGVFPPVQPASIPDIPDVAANEKYLHIWVGEIPGNVAQLTFFGTAAHGVSTAAAQTYNTTDGTWWVTGLPLSAGISAYAFSATVVGALIASTTYVDEAIAAIPPPAPASGGFPMTRTQVFSATLTPISQTTLVASEAWLPNQLYEAVLTDFTRHLFVTQASGIYFLSYPVFTNIQPGSAADIPHMRMGLNIGQTSIQQALTLDTAGNTNVIINKLT